MRETGPARSLLGLQLVLGPSRFATDRIGVSAMKFPARILAAIAAILLVSYSLHERARCHAAGGLNDSEPAG